MQGNGRVRASAAQPRWFVFLLFLTCLNSAAGAGTEASLYAFRSDLARPHDRVVLILPGQGRTTTAPEYQTIGDSYARKGITPVYVEIHWQEVGLNDLAAAAAQISAGARLSYPQARFCLFGFSFGAVIAAKVSEALPAEQVLLCSMTPLLAGDLPYQVFPFRQVLHLLTIRARAPLEFAPNDGGRLVFLYGDSDSFLFNAAIIAHRQSIYPRSRTIIVPHACHAIGAVYLAAIDQVVQENP